MVFISPFRGWFVLVTGAFEMIPNNVKAFLTMIAISEGTQNIGTHQGYDVLVGSTKGKPNLFCSYQDHPRVFIDLGYGLKSSAAGRSQILARYYDAYKKKLKLPDFSPDSQDQIAMQLLKECRALPLIEIGDFAGAVKACASRWASLPGAGYKQHENQLVALQIAYVEAGGLV